MSCAGAGFGKRLGLSRSKGHHASSSDCVSRTVFLLLASLGRRQTVDCLCVASTHLSLAVRIALSPFQYHSFYSSHPHWTFDNIPICGFVPVDGVVVFKFTLFVIVVHLPSCVK